MGVYGCMVACGCTMHNIEQSQCLTTCITGASSLCVRRGSALAHTWSRNAAPSPTHTINGHFALWNMRLDYTGHGIRATAQVADTRGQV